MTSYYYKDSRGEWRWNLKTANGRILADSGEGYKSEQECKADIDRVKGSASAPEQPAEGSGLRFCDSRSPATVVFE